MRMSITQILTTLCVQFYTCIYHGDMNKLQRAWDNLKVVKHQINWAEWREYNTLHEQLLLDVIQRLHATLPDFTWTQTETPFFLLSAVPALDAEDPLHDTVWFAHCRRQRDKARNKNPYTDTDTPTNPGPRKNITHTGNPYICTRSALQTGAKAPKTSSSKQLTRRMTTLERTLHDIQASLRRLEEEVEDISHAGGPSFCLGR